MALPISGQEWPPVEWAPVFDQYRLNDALYTGDVAELATIFAGAGPQGATRGDDDAAHLNTGRNRRRGLFSSLIDGIRSWFWGRRNTTGSSRTYLHSPLAGNLATLSADVLMTEPPNFRLVGANGEPLNDPAQDRLDAIMSAPATRAALIQAAEYTAGLSAVALTVQWDAAATDAPWIGVVACDAVVPEWSGGILVAMNMWTTYPVTDQAGQSIGVFYHMERHESGRIIHALYRGNESSIGVLVPLDSHESTAGYAAIPGSVVGDDEGGLTVALPTGTDLLTATWWRNLPTKRFRKHGILSRAGRADFEGVEHWLDQVDMVWSSWMRDIKLARARLIVSDSMLDTAGGAPSFDDDAEILKGLNMSVTNPDDPPITAHQFAIRAQEHADSILGLTKEVLQHAGYSLASYGEYGDVQKTATEVSDRKTATERTRDKKALYFVQAAHPLILALLDIDRAVYRAPGMPASATLDIVFPEVSQVDPEAQARVFGLLRTAMVASTRTMVTALHPDWDKRQIDEEVDEILAENPMSLGVEIDPGAAGRDGNAPGEPPAADAAGEPLDEEVAA